MGLLQRECSKAIRPSRIRGIATAAVIAFMLVFALMATSGCSCKKTETKSGTVLANNVPVNAITLARGDAVEVVGEENGYYKLKYSGESGSVTENGKGSSTLLVEKWLVRLDSEATPSESKAYSKEGCQLFDNPYFEGTAIASPAIDTELTVCDQFERCAYVKMADGKTGYVNTAFLGTEKEPEESAEDDASSQSDYGYSSYYGDGYSYDGYEEDGGSSYGGSSGWTGGAIDTSTDTGADGEDIVLASLLANAGLVDVAYAAEQSTQSSGKGTVLADNTKSYLAFLNRGDAVDIVIQSSDASASSTATDATVHVLIDGQIGSVPSYLVRDDDTAPYSGWTGYATADALVYGDYTLLGDIKTCEVNTEVSVLDDLGSCYVVQVDGLEGYMKKDQVSKEQIEVQEEESDSESSGGYSSYYSYGYSYYGGSSEGTSVDAGNSGSAQSVIEAATGGWTEEKL